MYGLYITSSSMLGVCGARQGVEVTALRHAGPRTDGAGGAGGACDAAGVWYTLTTTGACVDSCTVTAREWRSVRMEAFA